MLTAVGPFREGSSGSREPSLPFGTGHLAPGMADFPLGEMGVVLDHLGTEGLLGQDTAPERGRRVSEGGRHRYATPAVHVASRFRSDGEPLLDAVIHGRQDCFQLCPRDFLRAFRRQTRQAPERSERAAAPDQRPFSQAKPQVAADESGYTPTLGQPWPRPHPDPPDQVLYVRRRARCGRWDFSGIFGREASGVREANVRPKDVEPSPIAGPTRIRCVHRSRQDQDRGDHSELQLLAVHDLASMSVTTSTLLAERAASQYGAGMPPRLNQSEPGHRADARGWGEDPGPVPGRGRSMALRPYDLRDKARTAALRCSKGQRRHFK